uniref:Tyrosine specific protein phosphatases domain-containing protein n=1 Tax=Acrobeloides nanus TaxID=290746 RepID=A0A914C2F4_9BILA
MDEVLPHLYVGSLRDAMSREQLEAYRIEAVVSVYDFGRDELGIPDLKRMRLKLADSSAENVRDHFSAVNSFIHYARMKEQNVLVHCLAGASRSVCFVVAYDVLSERERLKQEFNSVDFDSLFLKDCFHSNSLHLRHDSITENTQTARNGLSNEISCAQTSAKGQMTSDELVFIDE